MRSLTALALAALLFSACTPAQEPAPPPEPMQESVEDVTAAIEATYVDMVAAQDDGTVAQFVASHYTSDATFHPPETGPVHGHEGIAAAFTAIIDAGLRVKPVPVSVDVFGDVAFEYGIGEITLPDGQMTQGAYVALWKRQNSVWKMHRDFVSGTTP